MADYQIDTLLAERKAVLVEFEGQALEADRVLKRRWDSIPNKYLKSVEADVRARRFETDPKCDTTEATGKWRIVKVEAKRGDSGSRGGSITETLALGLQTTLPEDEARVRQIEGSPSGGSLRLTRAWVYVDPESADTLITALNAVKTVTNPQGDEQTFTGTFSAGLVSQTENDDGSVTISQLLSKVDTVDTFAELYALTPAEINQTKQQVHPFDPDGDFNVYTVNQTVCRETQTFKNIYAESQDTINAFTPAQLTAFAPSGFSFLDKELKEEQDGTLSLAVTFQDITDKDVYVGNEVSNASLGTTSTELYLEQANDTPLDTSGDVGQGSIVSTRVSRRENGTFDKEKEVETSIEQVARFRSQSSLFRLEDEILYSNHREKIEAPTATGSGIYTVSQRQNRDGTYSGTLTYEQGLGQGEVRWDSEESTLRAADSVLYKDWDEQVMAPSSVQGAIYSTTNTLSDRGTYDARLVYEESNAETVLFPSRTTAFRDANTILYENSRAKISAPDATGSGVYTVSQRLNQDGTYTGSLVYEDGLNSGEAEFAARNSQLSNDNAIIYRARTSQVDAPTSTQGAIYDATNSLGDDGLYDSRLIYEESLAETAHFDSSVSAFRDARTILYENSRTKIEPPATVTGSGVYSVTQRINEDGTYSGQLVYEAGLNAGEAQWGSRNSALSNDNSIIYRSRTSQVEAPGDVQGAVYDVSNELGNDGLYDARLVYQESIADNVQFNSTATAFVTGTSIVYENSRTAISAPSSVTGSGVYRVSQRFNEDGTYTGSLVYENGTSSGTIGFLSRDAVLSNADSVIYKDSNSVVGAPGGETQGAIYSVNNTLTERGTYDSRLVYDVSVAKTASFRSQSTTFIDSNTILYENSRSKINAPDAAHGVYSVNQRINEDGTYSGSLVYQEGQDAGEAEWASKNSTLSNDNSIIYRSRTTQVDAPSSVQGAVYDVTNSLGNDGLYDARLVYQESISDNILFTGVNGPFNQSNEILYENSKVKLTAPDADSGLYRVSQRINEDGTYSGSLTYSTSDNSAVARFPSERSTLQDSDNILYRDQTSIITAEDAAQSGIYAARNSLNDRGLYDGSLVYQTSTPDSIGFVSSRTPFAQGTELLYENNLDIITAPATNVGIYRVSQRLNQDGTYTGSLVYNATVDGGEARVDSQSSLTALEVDVLYKSTDAVVPADLSDAQGTIYNTSNTLRDDGLYDARLVYRASKPVSVEFSSTEGPLDASESILYRNNTAQINPPAGVDGLYNTSNSFNEDGTYNGTLTYSKGIPFATTHSWSSNNQDHTLYIYKNQETVDIPAASVYNQNSLSVVPNRDGTYDVTFTTVDNDTFMSATPGEGSTSASVYLYNIDKKKYYQDSQAWATTKEKAQAFMEGNGAANITYDTAVGDVIAGNFDNKQTSLRPAGRRWWTRRLDVYLT